MVRIAAPAMVWMAAQHTGGLAEVLVAMLLTTQRWHESALRSLAGGFSRECGGGHTHSTIVFTSSDHHYLVTSTETFQSEAGLKAYVPSQHSIVAINQR
jgi:hypothetical protein